MSKASEYAIKATIFIASQSASGRPINLKEVSGAISSPEAYTAKILQNLVKSDILESVRGANGGFKINAERRETINLLQIVICIDGTTILTKCVLGLKNCNSSNPCPLHDKYSPVRESTIAILQDSFINALAIQLEKNNFVLKN